MPRTKYTRKAKVGNELPDEYNMKLKAFERHMEKNVAKFEEDAKAEIRSFETFVDMMVSRLPLEIRRMTLGEILDLDNLKENCDEVTSSEMTCMRPPTVIPGSKVRTAVKRATTVSDDGYATEGGGSVCSTSQAPRIILPASTPAMKKTRSSSRLSKAKSVVEGNQRTVRKTRASSKGHQNVPTKLDIFKTPAPSKTSNVYGIVTPKIKPNTPMNILRRPRQGEMVLSMQGSPLLVSAVIEEKTANINVPLSDGNMMSLLPQEGLRTSIIPPLGEDMMNQLETLKKHIEKVISLK